MRSIQNQHSLNHVFIELLNCTMFLTHIQDLYYKHTNNRLFSKQKDRKMEKKEE